MNEKFTTRSLCSSLELLSCNSSYIFSFILLNSSFICGMVEYILYSANSNKWLTGICQRKNLWIVSRQMGNYWWCWTILQSILQVRVTTVFTVFRMLTDFVCLYTYEFWLFLCKIVRSSIILLLPLFPITHQNCQFDSWTVVFHTDVSENSYCCRNPILHISTLNIPRQSVDYSRNPRMTKIEPEYI